MTANMILATRPVILEQWAGGLDRVYELHKWIGAGIAAAVLLHSQIGFEQVSGVLPPGSIGETAAEVGELVLWPFVALWPAPIGWSGLIVSASSVSGPSARCFLAQAGDIPRRCAA